jgi:Flp pilus assembly protein TadD
MRHLLVVLGLAAAVGAVYGRTLGGSFIYDDVFHIVENPGLRDLGDLRSVLRPGVQETRPVFLLSLALNYRLGGSDPAGYRLLNLVLHFLCALLLYGLALQMVRDLAAGRSLAGKPVGTAAWFPALSALLFALHPLATEAVTYVNSRSGLLAAVLGLAGMLGYVRHLDRPPGPARVALFAGALLCTALAMGSKESAVVYPLLLGAYLVVFRHGGSLRAALRPSLWPLLACVLLVPLLFLLVDNPHRGTVGPGTLPLVHHWLTQLRVLAYLLYLVLVPLSQNIDYDFRVSTGLGDWQVWAAAALLALLAYRAVGVRRRAPILFFAWLWFFGGLAPTNSLVPFLDFIAERHLYTALPGFSLAAGWAGALALAASARLRPAVALGIGCYLASLGLLGALRNQVLADPERLWAETVEASPNKARPHLNLAIHLLRRGQQLAGQAHLQRALELDPKDASVHYNLGVLAEHRRQDSVAGARFGRALELARCDDPERRRQRQCRRYGSALARVRIRQGAAQYAAGRYAQAEALFRQAVAADPAHAGAHYNLGVTLQRQGRLAAARHHLQAALRLDPGHRKARQRLSQLQGMKSPP